jgi:hypothetical protein
MHKFLQDALNYVNINEPKWAMLGVKINRYDYLLEFVNKCTDKDLALELYCELQSLTDDELNSIS